MKGAKIVLFIGAGLYAVYAIIGVLLNVTTYASYIDYYGLSQVLPTMLEPLFSYSCWAFALFALGMFAGHLEKQAAPAVEAAEEAVEIAEAEEAAAEPEAEAVTIPSKEATE